MLDLILASSSPRRKELLKLVGIEPRIIVPHVDEFNQNQGVANHDPGQRDHADHGGGGKQNRI